MIVSCPSCESKYQVADDKVAGNVMRTRCKACGTQIIVDGTSPQGGDNEPDEDDVTRIMRPGDHPDLAESLPPASGNRWTVNVGESDTRPMSANEIVQAFVSGALGEGVSVWKNGMASWAQIADVPELMTAIEATGHRPRSTVANPAATTTTQRSPTARTATMNRSGTLKPPPVVRGDSGSIEPNAEASRAAPGSQPSSTRTSKPPPPTRASSSIAASQTNASNTAAKASSGKVSPVATVSKRVEASQDALDPAASTGDFYSKLLAKVGASKTQSIPPSTSAESKTTQAVRGTMPPPRGPTSVAPSKAAPGRSSTAGRDVKVADVPSNLDPDAAPDDFYAKILAKVRPQKADAEAQTFGTGRATLTPPAWDANSNQPDNYAQAHPPSQVPASAQQVSASPIRVLAPATPSVRAAPSPPRRPDPEIPVDIQLPPMDRNGETRLPGSAGVLVSASSRPPAAERKSEPKPESTTGAAARASREIASDATSPDLRGYRTGKRRRSVGVFIGVITLVLLIFGGGVAATVFMLKPSSTKNGAPVPSVSVAVVAAVPPNAVGAIAPSPAAAESANSEATIDGDQLLPGTPGAANAAAMKGFGKQRGSRAAASSSPPAMNAQDTPKSAPKTPAPTGAQDSTLPSWLEAAGESKNKNDKNDKTAKTAAPKAPPAPVGKPFNRDAAMAVLGIAASRAPSCKQPGGATGNGKALVTFDTDGAVVIANVVGENMAGTPVARCVAGIFQRIKVAPFSGDRATVSKPFSIPP